jgi:hypothetical protein
MVHFDIFRSKNFAGTALAMVGYAAGAQVMIFYLPLYLQNAFGFTPVIAGISMLPFALPMFLVPRLGAKLMLPPREIISLGLSITVIGNVVMALLSGANASYYEFAAAMIVAGTGAGLLNGETAKAMQGALPPERSGVASGIASTIRFTALLFGVAALGAILVNTMLDKIAPIATQYGLAMGDAIEIAKRFSAGDAGTLISKLPIASQHGIAASLRSAFEAGFGGAAWTAAGVAFVTLLLSRVLMTGRSLSASNSLMEKAPFVAAE